MKVIPPRSSLLVSVQVKSWPAPCGYNGKYKLGLLGKALMPLGPWLRSVPPFLDQFVASVICWLLPKMTLGYTKHQLGLSRHQSDFQQLELAHDCEICQTEGRLEPGVGQPGIQFNPPFLGRGPSSFHWGWKHGLKLREAGGGGPCHAVVLVVPRVSLCVVFTSHHLPRWGTSLACSSCSHACLPEHCLNCWLKQPQLTEAGGMRQVSKEGELILPFPSLSCVIIMVSMVTFKLCLPRPTKNALAL